jgi:hypothetical protein
MTTHPLVTVTIATATTIAALAFIAWCLNAWRDA